MIKSIIIKAQLHYFALNERSYNKLLTEGLRFSIWRDENDFTAAEISNILDESFIKPGEMKEVNLKILNTKLARSIKVGELLYIGVPHEKIGECHIIDIIST